MKESRRRYVVFRIAGSEEIEKDDVARSIVEVLLKLFGEVGVSYMNLRFIDYDKVLGFGIIRCGHKLVDELRAGLCLISEIRNVPVLVDVVKVTGSLRKAKKAIKEYMERLQSV